MKNKIDIRPALYSDVPKLIPMAKDFFDESKWAEVFGFTEREDDTMRFLAGMVRSDEHGFFVAANGSGPVGFMIVGVRPWVMHFGEKIGYEMFYYMDKAHRRGAVSRRLVKAYEEWAREQGAHVVEFGVTDRMRGDKMEKFLHRLGYSPELKSYIKKLED